MANNQQKKKSNVKLIAAIGIVAIIVAAGGFVVLSSGGLLNIGIPSNTGGGSPQAIELPHAQVAVRIPVATIGDTVSFYSYKSNGTAIKFFAVKGSDGNVHVAFDTCDVCGPKGYKQSGSDVVCLNCGKTFEINSLGTSNKNGGCNPSYLPMRLDGNAIVIKTSDLVAKESVFRK